MKVEAGWIDSWRRSFDGRKEFVSFRIIFKLFQNEKIEVKTEKRYSELLDFHRKIRESFKNDVRLKEAFPGKQPFSRQDDLFLDRRMKSLDAYLQLLIYNLKTSGTPQSIEKFNRFFNINEHQTAAGLSEPIKKTFSVKTPNLLNSELERLKREFYLNPIEAISKFSDDFSTLKGKIEDLRNDNRRQQRDKQGEVDDEAEDSRLIEKFYEFKREWEIEQIKSGNFESSEFFKLKASEIQCEKAEKKEEEGKVESILENFKAEDISETCKAEDVSETFVFEQEALLNDLAETLAQQKKISSEIYSEIVEQNRAIEGFGRKQEDVMDGFKESTLKAKKLQ